MGYIYIAGCILFTVYGQLIIKWRMSFQPELPGSHIEKVSGLLKLIFLDFYILSGLISAFVASLFWMAAMTKFSLSFAYPFMSLAFVLVMMGSAVFFGENLTTTKILGTLVIVVGVIILSRGYQ